jgi:RNA polymerase sigma-70 factor (ECF subfamily)
MSFRTARPSFNELAPLEQVRDSEGTCPAENRGVSGGSSMLSRINCQLRTDEELVATLQEGETEALTVLYERHSSLVYQIARRILRDDAEAEDAVQQVFLDFFRSVAKFDPAKGTFKVWLLMYAYHRTLNHRRGLKAARFYEMEEIDALLQNRVSVDAKRPFPYLPAEAAQLVREALAHIQPRQKEVIELVYYEGCTAEEIAERTGDSANVVRHNLYRGMEKARSILESVLRGREQIGRGKTRRS